VTETVGEAEAAMGIRDFFSNVKTASPEEIRAFMRAHKPGEYQLVDVRSLREYERGHLPGARLIPVNELPARLAELDRSKRTFVY